MSLPRTPIKASVRLENLVDALEQAKVEIDVRCWGYAPNPNEIHELTSSCNPKEVTDVRLPTERYQRNDQGDLIDMDSFGDKIR